MQEPESIKGSWKIANSEEIKQSPVKGLSIGFHQSFPCFRKWLVKSGQEKKIQLALLNMKTKCGPRNYGSPEAETLCWGRVSWLPLLCTRPSASTVGCYQREDNGLNEYFRCTGIDFLMCLIKTLQLLRLTANKTLLFFILIK